MDETVNYLSFYHPLSLKTISFKTSKSTDKNLKNHYINSSKTSITNGKNTYKKPVLKSTANQLVIKQ